VKDGNTLPTDEVQSWLEGLSRRLHSDADDRDPLIWAATCALDSAALLLLAYGQQDLTDSGQLREAILAAVGSARAAVGAATFAAQEQIGRVA
jgi:hypothetical protein